MRTFLRIGLLSISFLMLSMIPSKLYAQLDSVGCPSSAAGGPNESTDIGRFVIGKDTIGSLYSHLGNSNANVHYVYVDQRGLLIRRAKCKRSSYIEFLS